MESLLSHQPQYYAEYLTFKKYAGDYKFLFSGSRYSAFYQDNSNSKAV